MRKKISINFVKKFQKNYSVTQGHKLLENLKPLKTCGTRSFSTHNPIQVKYSCPAIHHRGA